MKTITFTSNWGNFDYSATADFADEVLSTQAENYIRKGIANDMYRAAGSGVEKVFEEKFPAVKLRDKTVDAADRGRRAVPFNTETTKMFETAANDMAKDIAKSDGGPVIVVKVTGQHEYGAGSNVVTKEATELWTKVQGLPKERFETTLKTLGLGDDYTDESGVAACRNFMLDAKRKAAEAAKNALGGL